MGQACQDTADAEKEPQIPSTVVSVSKSIVPSCRPESRKETDTEGDKTKTISQPGPILVEPGYIADGVSAEVDIKPNLEKLAK